MPEVGHQPPVGVLVVHGIGAQRRGDMLEGVGNGLRRVFPDLSGKLREGEVENLGGRPVRFYEVYWADLLMGERVKGMFDMNELQSLAWFPFLNQRSRAYAGEPYPFRTVLWWTMVLPPLNFAVFLAYWGARLLVQMWDALWHRDTPRPPAKSGDGGPRGFWKRSREAADATAHGPNTVDRLLDEYVGDVLNYLNSAGDMFAADRDIPDDVRNVYRGILDRFYEQLARARNDGCEVVQIIAHSLGTVVAYHAMRGLRIEETEFPDRDAIAEGMGRIEHLYTIGSPLEKIRFFWPRLRPRHDLVGDRSILWDNFISYFDPIAGVLRRYREWGEVRNHRLLGGGFLTGHIVYQYSPIFLEAFTEGLLGTPQPLRRGPGQRIRDFAMLLGETLVAPAGLLIVIAAGVALWVLTALLVPFVISLPFRPFYGAETWGPILDYGSAFFLAMFLLTFSVNPWIRAKQTFRRLWGNDLPEDNGAQSDRS